MAPGWYPDPQDPAPYAPTLERWWTGTEWTGHTRPTQLGQPARVSPQRAYAVLAVLGLVVILVLVFTGAV